MDFIYALSDCAKYFFYSFKNTNIKINKNTCLPLKKVLFEVSFHYESFLYSYWIKRVGKVFKNTKFISFEQISWAAEIEKNLYDYGCKVDHFQVGILPPFPYPTIGIKTNIFFRTANVLDGYNKLLPERNFKKLKIDKKLFKKIKNIKNIKNIKRYVIFASQPYRKDQEKDILNILFKYYGNKLRIKIHQRDSNSEYKHIKKVHCIYKDLVITRTSSLSIELFQKEYPMFVSLIMKILN